MKPILSITELEAFFKQRPVLLIDARGGANARESYLSGHLPGAVFVDLETELSTKADDAKHGGRHPLPSPKKFCALLSELGLTPEVLVVVYDDKKGANAAARFWWMVRAIGHEQAAVLDGDYHAAIAAGLASEIGPVPRRSTTHRYNVTTWRLPLATMSEVEQESRTGQSVVIDVRERFRFRGDSEPIDLVAGHIPGAVNLPFVENLSVDGRLLDPSSLKARFAPLLEDRKSDQVIVHCGSGVTACHTLLAMEAAGFSGARLYVGSWSEWSRNDRPILTGD